MSTPSITTLPLSGLSRPMIVLRRTDLPVPEGPSITQISPAGTVRVTSPQISCLPKLLVKSLISISTPIFGLPLTRFRWLGHAQRRTHGSPHPRVPTSSRRLSYAHNVLLVTLCGGRLTKSTRTDVNRSEKPRRPPRTTVVRDGRRPVFRRQRSLQGDGGAGALEGLLGLLRGLLVDLLEDGLGSRLDEVLGLLQAEARQGADLLDDVDLLLAGSLEDDVELVLLGGLFGSRAGAAGGGSSGNGDRSGRGHAEGLLELLHELAELQEGHLLESVEQLVGAELRHGGVPFSWCLVPGGTRRMSGLGALRAVLGGLGGLLRRGCVVGGGLGDGRLVRRGLLGRGLLGGVGRRGLRHLGRLGRRLAGATLEDRGVLLGLRLQGAGEPGSLREGGVEQVDGLAQRSEHRARQLAQENLAGLEIGQLGDLLGVHRGTVDKTTLDDEGGIRLGKVTQALRYLDQVAVDEGDGGRTGEQVVEPVDARLLGGDLGQRVLDHGVVGVLAEGSPQFLQLLHGETAVLGQHSARGFVERVDDLRDGCCLVWPRHGSPSNLVGRHTAVCRPSLGPGRTGEQKRPVQVHRAYDAARVSLGVTCAGRPLVRTFGSQVIDRRSLASGVNDTGPGLRRQIVRRAVSADRPSLPESTRSTGRLSADPWLPLGLRSPVAGTRGSACGSRAEVDADGAEMVRRSLALARPFRPGQLESPLVMSAWIRLRPM